MKNPGIIPEFIRVLIIDDEIAANTESGHKYREFISNVFTALVFEKVKDRLLPVEIEFESNPSKGYKRWLSEPFDLTLIDVNFSKNREHISSNDEFEHYILNSEYQGVQIFQLMQNKIFDKGPLRYRKSACCIRLWTGEKNKTVEDLFAAFQLKYENEYVLLKASSFDAITNVLCKKILCNPEDFEIKYNLERLLFALEKGYCSNNGILSGGCLIADKTKKFEFLPEIPKNDLNSEPIRLCKTHIPQALLDGDTRFIPLDKRAYNGNIASAITYLIDGSRDDHVDKYCTALKNRHRQLLNQQNCKSRLPWFPKVIQKESDNQLYFIAAATPLTGISVVGEENAISALTDKVIALLAAPFDKVILKTTYLDSMNQWENAWWPKIHIQSHMRSRCLYPDTGTPTLWNSGKTSMETLPPRQLNKLLIKLAEKANDTARIVISLGSKFPMGTGMTRKYPENVSLSLASIWRKLFEEVYKNLDYNNFPLIEINVRHFLREIVHYHLGGDEYLAPKVLNEKSTPDPEKYWFEFKRWLTIIHNIAVDHKKKLILKLPHRSDALAYVECIVALREHHLVACFDQEEAEYGIRGITIINALKTLVPRQEKAAIKNYSSEWYGDPDSWGDAKGKLYQMSGRLVGAYRNQIVAGLLSSQKTFRDLGLEIWISGGMTSSNEVRHCKQLECNLPGHSRLITGIQIGTWALLDTNLKQNHQNNWWIRTSPELPAVTKGNFKLNIDNCKQVCCEDIHKSCEYNALASKVRGSKVTFLDDGKCSDCCSWRCIEKCNNLQKERIFPKNQERTSESGINDQQKAFLPRFSFLDASKCRACGRCSKTFYCDSFLDRDNTNLPPLLDSRYCNGCGLCTQICPEGALQLYKPEEFLVIVSSLEDLKVFLNINKIPHLHYHPAEDLENFPLQIRELLKTKKAGLEKLWSTRINNDKFMFNQDEPNLYPEQRAIRQEACIKIASDLYDDLESDSNSKIAKKVFGHAAQWSQLIWSDPGQVLWDSFLLSIESSSGSVNSSGNIVYFYTLLRQGRKLPLKPEFIEPVDASCNEDKKKMITFDHFSSIWKKIILEISQLSDKEFDKDKKDFLHLCTAVDTRTRNE